VAVSGVAAACGSEPEPYRVTSADAYTAIVDWQAEQWTPPPDDEEALPVIYVVATGGETIDVAVQAAVTEATADAAVVRFADEAKESFDAATEGAPVHDDGVMLAVGAVPEPAFSLSVDVERFEAEAESEQLTVDITARRPSDENSRRAVVTDVSSR
jgi:hypothetical protein